VPTPSITSEPTPAPTYATTGLVIHMTNHGDTGSSGPGTTVLDDGRIIWTDHVANAVESRLGSDALARVRHRVENTGALDRSANYFPERRPGPEPPGHGVGGYQFEVVRDGLSVVVYASDPRSFAGEAAYWVIPPEMDELAKLADHLNDPVAWLASDSFVEATRPYRADRYLVQVFLDRGGFESGPDVDAVQWPFGERIESVGEPFDPGFEGPEARCLIIDSVVASLTVAAEKAVGVLRDLRVWTSSVAYDWPRIGGSVAVEITPILPYERGSCAELATTVP
jgi:hypothetical protein